jgi:hypothetical protein
MPRLQGIRGPNYVRGMDRKAIDTLFGHWHGTNLEGEPPSPAAYSRLAKAVRELVPDSDDYSAVMLGSGERAVLVLHPYGLFIGTASGPNSNIRVEVRKESLERDRISVSMAELSEEKGSYIDYARTWTLKRDGEEFLTVKTTISRRDPDYDARPEEFMHRLCAQVGWAVPVDESA